MKARILLSFVGALISTAALAQSVPLQGGPWTAGRAPMYAPSNGGAKPLLTDSGSAAGGVVGLGFGEMLLQARALGAAPYANAGSGPLGSNFCNYDGPATSAAHYLCFSPNAQGGGLIAYGAVHGASTLPLYALINGTQINLGAVAQISGTPTAGQLAQYVDAHTIQGLTTGTGVATALGVNVGSAGAVVVNGGALGTPSSAVLTNATGLPIGTGVTGLGTGVGTALAAAANSSGGVATQAGAITAGNCLKYDAAGGIADAGATCGGGGGGGSPGGTSGQVQYNAAGSFGGLAGSSVDGTNRTLALTSAALTTNIPILALNPTWNASGTDFTAFKLNVTNTASGAGSLLADFQVGGTSVASITKAGRLNGGSLSLGAASDVIVSRAAAASLKLGDADAAAPVAQTLGVQNVVAGTTNTAGANFVIRGSAGTGTGVSGSLLFQVAPHGTTGTAQNAFTTALTLDDTLLATFAGNVYGPNLLAASNILAGGVVGISGKSLFWSATDGDFMMTNSGGTTFGKLAFACTTSSCPAIKRNGAALNFRLADDSADASVTAATQLQADNSTNVATTAYVRTAVAAIGVPITPNVQTFTSSGTYTVPAGARALHIRMVGGGGGGGGFGGAGGTGGTSTFGTSLLTTNGGAGGATTGATGATGGTVTGCTLSIQGAASAAPMMSSGSATASNGASSPFGGGGKGSYAVASNVAGGAATGYGAGGGGELDNTPTASPGGAAGGYCEHWITSSLGSSYAVVIGAAGSAGASGGVSAGGAGTGGVAIVEAY